MKKKYVIGIIILILIIAIILCVFLYNKDNTNSNFNNEKEKFIVANALDNNVIIEDKYANLTTEQKNALIEKRSVDKVSLQIKEGTLTKEGATIVITDKNDYPYSYGEYYTIKKLENGEWRDLKSENYNINDLLHETDNNGKVTMEFNWKDRYGELENGKYRLLMEINPGNPDTAIYTEFEIK